MAGASSQLCSCFSLAAVARGLIGPLLRFAAESPYGSFSGRTLGTSFERLEKRGKLRKAKQARLPSCTSRVPDSMLDRPVLCAGTTLSRLSRCTRCMRSTMSTCQNGA